MSTWVRLHGVARELAATAPDATAEGYAGTLVTVDEAAALAGVSRRTIMRWLASGRLVSRGRRTSSDGAHLLLADDVLSVAA